jgi:hypothetical protein
MAKLTKGHAFGVLEEVTYAKLNNLVDDATVTNIVNADIGAGANIDSSKLNLATSGYMTTGGNFTITGTHTFTTAPVLTNSMASQEEAEAGTNQTKLMNPLRTKQSVDSRIDTDGALTANSDAKVPSQKAVKTYVDTEIASIDIESQYLVAATRSSVFERAGAEVDTPCIVNNVVFSTGTYLCNMQLELGNSGGQTATGRFRIGSTLVGTWETAGSTYVAHSEYGTLIAISAGTHSVRFTLQGSGTGVNVSRIRNMKFSVIKVANSLNN